MQSHTARTSQSTHQRMSNPFALMVAMLIVIITLLPDISVGQTKEPSTGIITVRAYDSYSQHEISTVNVSLEPIMEAIQIQVEPGKYKIWNIPPGTYRLQVQFPSYHLKVIDHIKITNNDSLYFNVGITPVDTLTNMFYSLRLTSIQEAINMADTIAARGLPTILKPTPYDPNEIYNTALTKFEFKYDTISPKEFQYAFNKRMLEIMSKHYREEVISAYDSLISSWK
ncbi:MAG: carboxypeptidase regulatory-like domain-containing protein [Bacteroidetes bacterium]|nr:carboxypeptidase regulatory-like domain-containing protein [Bacteroidota bacterium]